jgi:hypothetical protein
VPQYLADQINNQRRAGRRHRSRPPHRLHQGQH